MIPELHGSCKVPGDKSIAHRALILAAAADGESLLTNIPEGDDIATTIAALKSLGALVLRDSDDPDALRIGGWGSRGPLDDEHREGAIDCGNAGTLARLLTGLLAGYRGNFTLDGDESLRGRPMRRILDPLGMMGARFRPVSGVSSDSPILHLPFTVLGSSLLNPLDYETPVSSAQVKSAILFAALNASGTTSIREYSRSRDHTERLLRYLGASLKVSGTQVSIEGPFTIPPFEYAIPGDTSSASYIAAAAALVPGSEVKVTGVCLNLTRLGFLDCLSKMGVYVGVDQGLQSRMLPEPLGDVSIRRSHFGDLKPIQVSEKQVPSLIDELPLLALISSTAIGRSVFQGIGELRNKESDRLDGMCQALRALGVDIELEGDTLSVEGKGPFSVDMPLVFDSKGDHRMALTWMVLRRCLAPNCQIVGESCCSISYPGFKETLDGLEETL